MEFEIKAKDGAIPCEIVIDEDNGRYMLRNSDTSGEVFHNAEQLKNWVQMHWHEERFEDPSQFQQLMNELNSLSSSLD